MNRLYNFAKRNLKEMFRDPIIYIFCIMFPIVMLAIFQILGSYVDEEASIFELLSLLPGIIVFSYSFVMLVMSLLVSKDRETFFLKRLYSSPMKYYHYILGYALVGFLIGVLQTIICILSAYIISIITSVKFLSIGQILLLMISQMPMLIINVSLGILVGTIFNDKSAPGICSAIISLSGMIGGCWMPIANMGGFEIFCRCLPFYPSVYIGRVISKASILPGVMYSFDTTAWLGIIPIIAVMVISVLLSFVIFKKNMVTDK